MKNLYQLALPIFSIVFAALVIKKTFAQSIDRVGAKQAYDNFISGNAVILDVREIEEINLGKIKDTKVLPMSLMTKDKNVFDKELDLLSKDKEIYVYCRSGRRSGIVGAYLKSKGYKVKNLGGYSDWEKLGLPIDKKGEN